jgi:hypothetical protein
MTDMNQTREPGTGRRTIRGITIREASRRLRKNPDFTRGAAASLGIQLERIGRALVMTLDDFQRLRASIEQSPEPIEASSDVCSSAT